MSADYIDAGLGLGSRTSRVDISCKISTVSLAAFRFESSVAAGIVKYEAEDSGSYNRAWSLRQCQQLYEQGIK